MDSGSLAGNDCSMVWSSAASRRSRSRSARVWLCKAAAGSIVMHASHCLPIIIRAGEDECRRSRKSPSGIGREARLRGVTVEVPSSCPGPRFEASHPLMANGRSGQKVRRGQRAGAPTTNGICETVSSAGWVRIRKPQARCRGLIRLPQTTDGLRQSISGPFLVGELGLPLAPG